MLLVWITVSLSSREDSNTKGHALDNAVVVMFDFNIVLSNKDGIHLLESAFTESLEGVQRKQSELDKEVQRAKKQKVAKEKEIRAKKSKIKETKEDIAQNRTQIERINEAVPTDSGEARQLRSALQVGFPLFFCDFQ